MPVAKMVLDESYRATFRKKLYNTLDELQEGLDAQLRRCNEERVHSGKYCFGKTPMHSLRDSIPLVKDKMLNQNLRTEMAGVLG